MRKRLLFLAAFFFGHCFYYYDRMRVLIITSVLHLFSSNLFAQEIERVQQMPTFAVGQISVTFSDTASESYSHQLIQEIGSSVIYSNFSPAQLYTNWTYPDSLRIIIESSPYVATITIRSMVGDLENATFHESMSDEQIEQFKKRMRNAPPALHIWFDDHVTHETAEKLLSNWKINYSDHNLKSTPRRVTIGVPEGEELQYMKNFEAFPAVISAARIAIMDSDGY